MRHFLLGIGTRFGTTKRCFYQKSKLQES